MVIPPVGGVAVAGASYDIGDDDPGSRADSNAGNLDRLARILPGAETQFDPRALEGRVGFRAVTPDRLPMVGPVPGMDGVHGAFAYASRGILWSSLMAELLASRIEGEPWPIERCLANALDPGRYERRAARGSTRREGLRGSRP
jgi:tRNA 5-methylaminomethyl-2-thiouridine biosynthesis bifunctional protein